MTSKGIRTDAAATDDGSSLDTNVTRIATRIEMHISNTKTYIPPAIFSTVFSSSSRDLVSAVNIFMLGFIFDIPNISRP